MESKKLKILLRGDLTKIEDCKVYEDVPDEEELVKNLATHQ